MKTVFSVFLIVFLLAVSVFDADSQAARVAEIIYVSGAVRIKTSASPDWVDAQEGMIIKEGDIVKTGDGSSAELAFGEELDNIINVFPNSQLVISSMNPGLVRLEEGRVFSLIKKLSKGSRFEVRTPTAVAGARGTGWGTGLLNDITQVEAFEKSVYVAGLGENNKLSGLRDMPEGFGTSVAKGGPGEFLRLSGEQMLSWRAWFRQAREHLAKYKAKKGRSSRPESEKLEEAENRSRILERVERETDRTEELRRDRRTGGGSSQGSRSQIKY